MGIFLLLTKNECIFIETLKLNEKQSFDCIKTFNLTDKIDCF